MHYGGIPCQIKEIVEICKKKIFLIEDACHALFTEYDNKNLGLLEMLQFLVFMAIKI